MATHDTVGYGFAPSGLTLAGTHKYSQGSNILSDSYQAMGIDKTKWVAGARERFPKEFWFKSNVVVSFSQVSSGDEGVISFAADEWHVLPIEFWLTHGYIKAANATNTSEYFFVYA